MQEDIGVFVGLNASKMKISVGLAEDCNALGRPKRRLPLLCASLSVLNVRIITFARIICCPQTDRLRHLKLPKERDTA